MHFKSTLITSCVALLCMAPGSAMAAEDGLVLLPSLPPFMAGVAEAIGAPVGWGTVMLLLFFTAQTSVRIPYLSLGAELTDDHHARTRLSAFREFRGLTSHMRSAIACSAFSSMVRL